MELGIPSEVWSCRIDTSGRIVVPHAVRAAKRIEPGQVMTMCRIGSEYVIRNSDETLDQLLAAFRSNIPPGVSLVDELLEERKAEAALEEARR